MASGADDSSIWTESASIVGVSRFPIHGTIASCIRAWRAAPKDQQGAAMLLTERKIRLSPENKEAATFEGPGLEALAEVMPKSMDEEPGPVLGGFRAPR